MLQKEQWNGFEGRLWKEEINVRDLGKTSGITERRKSKGRRT